MHGNVFYLIESSVGDVLEAAEALRSLSEGLRGIVVTAEARAKVLELVRRPDVAKAIGDARARGIWEDITKMEDVPSIQAYLVNISKAVEKDGAEREAKAEIEKQLAAMAGTMKAESAPLVAKKPKRRGRIAAKDKAKRIIRKLPAGIKLEEALREGIDGYVAVLQNPLRMGPKEWDQLLDFVRGGGREEAEDWVRALEYVAGEGLPPSSVKNIAVHDVVVRTVNELPLSKDQSQRVLAATWELSGRERPERGPQEPVSEGTDYPSGARVRVKAGELRGATGRVVKSEAGLVSVELDGRWKGKVAGVPVVLPAGDIWRLGAGDVEPVLSEASGLDAEVLGSLGDMLRSRAAMGDRDVAKAMKDVIRLGKDPKPSQVSAILRRHVKEPGIIRDIEAELSDIASATSKTEGIAPQIPFGAASAGGAGYRGFEEQTPFPGPGQDYVMTKDDKSGDFVVVLLDDWVSDSPVIEGWRGPKMKSEEYPRKWLKQVNPKDCGNLMVDIGGRWECFSSDYTVIGERGMEPAGFCPCKSEAVGVDTPRTAKYCKECGARLPRPVPIDPDDPDAALCDRCQRKKEGSFDPEAASALAAAIQSSPEGGGSRGMKCLMCGKPSMKAGWRKVGELVELGLSCASCKYRYAGKVSQEDLAGMLEGFPGQMGMTGHVESEGGEVDDLKAEMLNFLRRQFGSSEDGDSTAFDAEAAVWWFANDYHGGQGSDLYGVLSASEFKPGPTHKSVEDEGEEAAAMYDALEHKFGPRTGKSEQSGPPAPVREAEPPYDDEDDLRDKVTRAFDAVVQEMADAQAAVAWSTPTDNLIDEYGEDVYVEAEFGDALAVNGDYIPDQSQHEGVPEGYVTTGEGGNIPSTEEEVSVEHAARETEKMTGVEYGRILYLLGETGDQDNIHVSVSGGSEVWARPEPDQDEEPVSEDGTRRISPKSEAHLRKALSEAERIPWDNLWEATRRVRESAECAGLELDDYVASGDQGQVSVRLMSNGLPYDNVVKLEWGKGQGGKIALRASVL